jgi:hypothetical protein
LVDITANGVPLMLWGCCCPAAIFSIVIVVCRHMQRCTDSVFRLAVVIRVAGALGSLLYSIG